MIKHQQGPNDNPPIYKKIQNYIFKFSDLLGHYKLVARAALQLTPYLQLRPRHHHFPRWPIPNTIYAAKYN